MKVNPTINIKPCEFKKSGTVHHRYLVLCDQIRDIYTLWCSERSAYLVVRGECASVFQSCLCLDVMSFEVRVGGIIPFANKSNIIFSINVLNRTLEVSELPPCIWVVRLEICCLGVGLKAGLRRSCGLIQQL